MIDNKVLQYIISFLLADYIDKNCQLVFYGTPENAPLEAKVIIIPSDFFEDEFYGTEKTLPRTPFSLLPQTDIPFLFGTPEIEKTDDGRIILHADLIASAYFMLSRYEEIIKPQCRDNYGRFLAKDAVVFQQGYGFRPLVDEWGRYLRNLLRESGVIMPEENKGFSKIWLTHDIDIPFFFKTFKDAVKQCGRNLFRRGLFVPFVFFKYLTGIGDPLNVFPFITRCDNNLKKRFAENVVQPVYFVITRKNESNDYQSIKTLKYRLLLNYLQLKKSKLGLHISHEAGLNPELITDEIKLLPKKIEKTELFSRNHYLRWINPHDVIHMVKAGIGHDFTMGYADSVGFRVGTSKSYKYIDPMTLTVADLWIHPLLIMDNTLNEKKYMGLSENEALTICKDIANKVWNLEGELNILFHNSNFGNKYYNKQLYINFLKVLSEKI